MRIIDNQRMQQDFKNWSNALPGEQTRGIFGVFIIMVDRKYNIFPINEDYLIQWKVWINLLKKKILSFLSVFKLYSHAKSNAYL